MQRPPLASARRIVLLWIGRLGDILVSTPFLEGLRLAAPQADLVLVTAEAGEAGARLLDCVDEVAVVRKGRRLLGNAALLPVLRVPADLLVDMNSAPSGTAALLARLARAKVKAGFRHGRGDEVFGLRAEAAGEKEHMLERYARLAALLGFSPVHRMRVPVRADELAEADRILASLPQGRKPVAVFPGNFKKTENRWHEKNFAALADRLAEQPDLAPYWLAGPGERAEVEEARCRQLAAEKAPVLGPFPLAVTAALLKRSALYVGNCTGTSHLAVAVGTPTFTVLAGYTAAIWAPPGKPSRDNPHWKVVSPHWESCRSVGAEDAWTGLLPALKVLREESVP